jgi:hypothetical protein
MSTVFPTSPSNGDTYIPPQVQKLLASDAESNELFGDSVALSADGNTVVVGALGEDQTPSINADRGAVYIFTRSGASWTQQAKLFASDVSGGDYFGSSVALSSDGNTALIGALGETTSPNTLNGAAYVFTRSGSTWTEQQKLLASDPATGDNFGESVALSSDGNTALIGAANESTSPNTDQGAAYVFTRSTGVWTEQQKLLASDRATNDFFGNSVSLSSDGNTALIGAYIEDTSPNTNNGAAYIFTRSAGVWTEQQKILASDAASFDNFGYAVSLSSDGNTALIGSSVEDTSPNTDNGAAYVFTRSAGVWTEQQKLLASDPATLDRFGRSVSLSADGSTALIGAFAESTSPNSGNGAAYVFTHSAGVWTQKQKLLASDRANSDNFGFSVALSGDGLVAIVGAYLEDTSPNSNQGAAYIYNFTNTGTRYTYNSTDNRWEVDTSVPKKAPTTHLFTSSVSSWAIPTNARAIHAVVIGGGGGGGYGSTGTTGAGGGGGGGGGMSVHTYNLISGYQTTAVITVGAGGTSASGSSGTAGGSSSFRIADSGSLGTLIASGGLGGGLGFSTGSSGGTGGFGMFIGGNGGGGVTSGSNNSPATSIGARGGGSGGGRVDGLNYTGGSGDTSPKIWETKVLSPGIGGTGVDANTSPNNLTADGGLYGGGGGGGGARPVSGAPMNAGLGGRGAQGCVFLTVWYE